MKALGQNGLNFIANKFKELKDLLNNKIDKDKVREVTIVDIETKKSLPLRNWISYLRHVSETCAKSLKSKVTKVEGKGLSTNDYTNKDKAKVEAMKEQVILEETQYNALSSEQQNDSTKIYFILKNMK